MSWASETVFVRRPMAEHSEDERLGLLREFHKRRRGLFHVPKRISGSHAALDTVPFSCRNKKPELHLQMRTAPSLGLRDVLVRG